MDRRRLSPSGEGLEGRAMLSLFGGSTSYGRSAAANTAVSVQDLPETYQQKVLRIEHLPFYLEQEQAGRVLPASTAQHLQADMTAVIAQLHAPTTPEINAFNQSLRRYLPDKTLSAENALRLNHAFGAVLSRAGATPQETANLQQDMNELARADAQSSEPSILARNDYAVVLQTTLAVGRPMWTPTPAVLDANDGVRAKDGKSAITHDHSPTLVGRYEAGATKIGYVNIQVLDATGRVLGAGPVDTSGNYSVKVSTPLPDGTYAIRTRAQDEVGHTSDPSLHAYTVKIVTSRPRDPSSARRNPPGGPLGLR